MSNLYRLSGAQMARLRPYFPKSHGVPRVDDRRVLSGIIFINRNGLRWCDAPKEYVPPKALYNRWKRPSHTCCACVAGQRERYGSIREDHDRTGW
jgi:transposase